jgi:hypothetical protein
MKQHTEEVRSRDRLGVYASSGRIPLNRFSGIPSCEQVDLDNPYTERIEAWLSSSLILTGKYLTVLGHSEMSVQG